MQQPSVRMVTFLFVDVAGSTRLWLEHPHTMPSILRRLEELILAAARAHAGHLFKTVGDQACVAFGDAHSAVGAVLAMFKDCAEHPWPGDIELQLRAALHTGSAEYRDNDYFGLAVHHVARLLTAAQAGQVLLSASVAELIRASPPTSVTIHDLGRHQLRDFPSTEHIFQLRAPELPQVSSLLRTVAAHPQRPAQPTRLIGRDHDVAALIDLIQAGATRLLTLSGPGGVGKTRLALQLADDLSDTFPEGVVFVSLAELADADLVFPTVAATLQPGTGDKGDALEQLAQAIGARRLLLVLDNFEHVLQAALGVAQLLAICPNLVIVVTSRSTLELRGEFEVEVLPLDVPLHVHVPPEELIHFPAAELFLRRALARNADFSITIDNAPSIAGIIRRLDGLPLALELAAARIRTLSPQQLLARMDRSLDILSGGLRDLPPRQQTIRSTIAWSYDLLSEADQRLFRALTIFAGGCTLDAAEAVVGDAVPDVLNGIDALLDQHLLRQREQADGNARYWMLETIRAFGREMLTQHGELAGYQARHAAYYANLAAAASAELAGRDQTLWLDRLDQESANVRQALGWAIIDQQSPLLGLQMAADLSRFWEYRSHIREGRQWIEAALGAVPAADDTPTTALMNRARAFNGLGNLCWLEGDTARAIEAHQEALAQRRSLNDQRGIASSLNNLGVSAMAMLRGEDSLRYLEEALSIVRSENESSGATTAAGSTLSLLSLVLNNLGVALQIQGDYARSTEVLLESIAVAERVGSPLAVAYPTNSLGWTTLRAGDARGAATWFRTGLRNYAGMGNSSGAVSAIEGLAGVACTLGDWHTAARWLGCAGRLREVIGVPIPPYMRAIVAEYAERVRANLPADVVEAGYAEGRALSLHDVLGLIGAT